MFVTKIHVTFTCSLEGFKASAGASRTVLARRPWRRQTWIASVARDISNSGQCAPDGCKTVRSYFLLSPTECHRKEDQNYAEFLPLRPCSTITHTNFSA